MASVTLTTSDLVLDRFRIELEDKTVFDAVDAVLDSIRADGGSPGTIAVNQTIALGKMHKVIRQASR